MHFLGVAGLKMRSRYLLETAGQPSVVLNIVVAF